MLVRVVAASWLQRMSRVPAHGLKHMSSLLSPTRAHRRDSPIPPRARHFISDSLLQAIPQHRSRPVCMSHRASRRMRSATRSLTMFRCRPYGVAQTLGSGEIWEDIYLLLPRPGSSYPQRGTYSALSFSAMIICSRSTGRAIPQVCASLHSYTSICARRFVQANTIGERPTIRRIQ